MKMLELLFPEIDGGDDADPYLFYLGNNYNNYIFKSKVRNLPTKPMNQCLPQCKNTIPMYIALLQDLVKLQTAENCCIVIFVETQYFSNVQNIIGPTSEISIVNAKFLKKKINE